MNITIKAFAPRPKRPEYTDNELRTAFDKVKNKNNWKKPINRWIKESDLFVTEDAVIHYTGSVVNVVDEKEGKVKIHAEGYYNAIGM